MVLLTVKTEVANTSNDDEVLAEASGDDDHVKCYNKQTKRSIITLILTIIIHVCGCISCWIMIGGGEKYVANILMISSLGQIRANFGVLKKTLNIPASFRALFCDCYKVAALSLAVLSMCNT